MSESELTVIEAIHVATVLEDCIDQLSILGRIMPASYQASPEATRIVDEEIAQLVNGQKQLEANFEDAVSRGSQTDGRRAQSQNGSGEAMAAGIALRNSTQTFARTIKQSPLTADNMEKVQEDRTFLERVLYGTLLEVTKNHTFSTLTRAVQREKDKRSQLEETIRKEEESRKRITQLRKQLVETKKERDMEVQQRNEMIAHLKDQLQEMKAKTNMEGKYVKKVAEVGIAQTQKRCSIAEKKVKDEIETLKIKIDDENRVNAEIESFLRTHTEQRQELLQHWMEKYEKDVEAKQRELDLLKAAKAKDLERLQELTRLYTEYEQVVVEDRIEKEKARRKNDQEQLELKYCIKIQAWWRGTMVRRGLGPFKKKKGKAGGKGEKNAKDDKAAAGKKGGKKK